MRLRRSEWGGWGVSRSPCRRLRGSDVPSQQEGAQAQPDEAAPERVGGLGGNAPLAEGSGGATYPPSMKEDRMALEIGRKAPDFALADEDGKVVKLSDYWGKRVVVFFYPKANTSG